MAEPFDKRFERLVDMLYLLQSGSGHTTASLASRYGVAIRSIQRDIEDIKAARFPLQDLGRGRGHRLDPAYRLPQNALNLSEVLPLVLGAGLSSSPHRLTALMKLKAATVNGVERALLANLPERVAQPTHPGRGEEWLEPLSAAIAGGLRVSVDYSSRLRVLEPWSLLYQNMVWYLHALDVEAATAKRFRLNRLKSVEVLGDRIQWPRQPSQAACFHPWDFGTGKSQLVVMSITPDLEAWLDENPAHPSQALRDGVATYSVRNRDSFLSWILSQEGAELEKPTVWRGVLRGRLAGLLALYDGSGCST